ncbi:MAG: glycoside hydrolase family 99-like domain-containing protein [Desulfovibrio sp.]|jgi:lipopolysaccharide biosynthesis protein|nr:glycoside hydrolase family 99-like domain-containing protein [Desulfovibrio sp.]
MKAIAIYLPQYHIISENNEWWGEGFTEWHNVRAAVPYYEGHYQPHIPHKSIGYYNLLDENWIEKQHKMALRYGVSAFCYYYYNFAGKTLLEEPLRIIARHTGITNAFCLCWANHDWTRAWYGQNKEILIKQEYSRENAVKFFYDVKSYLAHERYITIDQKPFFLIYDPISNPLMGEYIAIWRHLAHKEGFAGLFLASVEALRYRPAPSVYGFDATVEFAPDWYCATEFAKNAYSPRVIDYQTVIANMISKPAPSYTRLRCVFPGWDNSPRYKNVATIFNNCTLGAFKYALEHAVDHTRKTLPQNLQYIFINAWNEWGEGCHLEPDERHGFKTLAVVRQVLGNV